MAERDTVLAEAEALKAEGNKYLAAKDFDLAIEYYSEAIKLNPNSHVYFSNRSAAYLSQANAKIALKDADMCISMKPDWAKGYSRKGAALHKLKKYSESVEAYGAGLVVDPNNAALKLGLEEVKQAKTADALSNQPSEDAEDVINTPQMDEAVTQSDEQAPQSLDGEVDEAVPESVSADDQPIQSLDGEVTSDSDEMTKSKKKKMKKKKKKAKAKAELVESEKAKEEEDEKPIAKFDAEIVEPLSGREQLRAKLRAKIAGSRAVDKSNIVQVDTQQQERVSGFRQQGEHGAKMRIKP
jgi:stress-induced-phosphoprotein 1